MTPKEQCIRWLDECTLLVHRFRHRPKWRASVGNEFADARWMITEVYEVNQGPRIKIARIDDDDVTADLWARSFCEDHEPAPPEELPAAGNKLTPLEQCRYWKEHQTPLHDASRGPAWVVDDISLLSQAVRLHVRGSGVTRCLPAHGVVSEFAPAGSVVTEAASETFPLCSRALGESLSHLPAALRRQIDALGPRDKLTPHLLAIEDTVRAALDIAQSGRLDPDELDTVACDVRLAIGAAAEAVEATDAGRRKAYSLSRLHNASVSASAALRRGVRSPVPAPRRPLPPPALSVACDHGHDDDSSIDWAAGPGIIGSR